MDRPQVHYNFWCCPSNDHTNRWMYFHRALSEISFSNTSQNRRLISQEPHSKQLKGKNRINSCFKIFFSRSFNFLTEQFSLDLFQSKKPRIPATWRFLNQRQIDAKNEDTYGLVVVWFQPHCTWKSARIKKRKEILYNFQTKLSKCSHLPKICR